MDWNYSQEEPQRLSKRYMWGLPVYTLVYNVEHLPNSTEEDEEWRKYRYKSITLEPGVWNYDAIVDALITAQYPTAKMQAIVNNYLAAPTDPDIKAEFELMQDWRTEAKQLAKDALTQAIAISSMTASPPRS